MTHPHALTRERLTKRIIDAIAMHHGIPEGLEREISDQIKAHWPVSSLGSREMALIAVLRKYQHAMISDTGGGDYCAACQVHEPHHAPDCEIALALTPQADAGEVERMDIERFCEHSNHCASRIVAPEANCDCGLESELVKLRGKP